MHPTRTVAIIGFLATSAAIVAVPLLLVPEHDRSAYFWWRIAWTEFLALLAWSLIGGRSMVSAESRPLPTFAGVAPAYGLVILSWGALSFGLVVCFAWLDPSVGPNSLHMALQVILLAATAIICALLYLPAHFAAKGTMRDTHRGPGRPTARMPFELASRLRSEEERFAGDRRMYQAIKVLREKVVYSLDGVAGVEGDPEYSELAARVMSVCNALQVVQPGDGSANGIDATLREVQTLSRMAASISDALKRRRP